MDNPHENEPSNLSPEHQAQIARVDELEAELEALMANADPVTRGQIGKILTSGRLTLDLLEATVKGLRESTNQPAPQAQQHNTNQDQVGRSI